MISNGRLAMHHVIEKLAPDLAREITGGMLLGLLAGCPGVTVQVDWPVFLQQDPGAVASTYEGRLAELREEDAALLAELGEEHTPPAAMARIRA
jgi:hypothetical protein